jgi:hypothetical protein
LKEVHRCNRGFGHGDTQGDRDRLRQQCG